MEQEAESIKVVLLGESGVGKTSIINQFIEENYSEDQQSTTGATFSTKQLTIKGKDIKFEIWDTAGQEKYRALTKMFYKDAAVAVFVYDITRQQSFDEIRDYWAEQVKEYSPKDIILAVAANKSDLYEKEEVEEEKGREFASSINAIFKSTSAKNASGIEDLFMDIGAKFVPNNDDNTNPETEEKKTGKKEKNITLDNATANNPPKKKKCC